ncbi:hypothetical protein TRFO_38640 [Tritrichomonas foetus]|uniref:Uncharacterized protein n=1 Tax=Tritrichomonas foetus TaxID=1144522 RepID=A0A1J4J7C2_9EUKA|nr:hypothetical protein TRFO_38640 [Tritrichomonas foetus]|eukprot:OHS95122.1 hypothetical protein TRFO_38640 [Tritrichomonas foetus]
MESKYNQNSKNLTNELNNVRREEQNTKKDLIAAVRNLESKLEEQNSKNAELNKINNQLKKQIESFLNTVSSKTQQKVTNMNEAATLYTELYSSSESASDKIKYLESENSSLLSQLDEATEKMKNSAKEAVKLRKRLKKTVYSNSSLIENEDMLKEIAHKMNKSHEKELKEAQSIISEQKEQISQLQTAINQTKKAKINRDFENNNNNYFNNNNFNNNMNTNSNNEIYETDIAILESKLKTTEQLVNDKNDAIHTLQETVDELKEKVNDLSDQLQESQVTVVAHAETIKSLHEKIKQAKLSMQSLKDEICSKDTEIQEYDTTVHELQLKINELESEKQQAALNKPKLVNEPVKLLKEKISLFETRVESLEELLDSQNNEICILHEQRKEMISKLLQIDNFFQLNEALVSDLVKTNNDLINENKQIKNDFKANQKHEQHIFNKAIDDILEIVPSEVTHMLTNEIRYYNQMNQNDNNNICDTKNSTDNKNKKDYDFEPANILVKIVKILVGYSDQILEETRVNQNSQLIDEMNKKYSALMNHLQNSVKILRSFANSQAQNADDLSRNELLASCARIGKFIQEKKIEIPIEDFKPSIFEPRDLNDPQKVADVFLDFVSEEKLRNSPIAELFTLFMCVVQVNQILVNNIDSNRSALEQAGRISQLQDSQQQQIHELETFKGEQETINKSLLPYLQKFIEKPMDKKNNSNRKSPKKNKNSTNSKNSQGVKNNQNKLTNLFNFVDEDEETLNIENYNDVANFIISNININDILPLHKTKQLISKIDDFEKQIDFVTNELEKKQESTSMSRAQFCKKADIMVEQLQKQIIQQNKANEAEKNKLTAQLNEAKRLLDKAHISYDSNMKKIERKLQKRDNLITSLRNENESLTQQSINYQNQLSQQQSQVDEENDAMSSLRTQLRTMAEKLQKMTEHKQHYKQRLMEADTAKISILNDLKTRNEDLSKKYAETITKMETELAETRESLANAQKEIEEFEQKKQELVLANAKLKLSERTTTLKLNAAQEALQRERTAYEARSSSLALALKAKSDAIVASGQENEGLILNLLAKIMIEEFDVTPENGDDIKLLMHEVEDALENRKDERFAICDALKLRRILRLHSKESLIDIFKNFERETQNSKRQCVQAIDEAKTANNTISQMTRDCQRMERAVSELNEWISWSRTMVRQVSDTIGMNPPVNEIRFILEEALLASLGQKDIRRKVDILRAEKKMLLSHKPILVKSPYKEQTRSARPIILAMIFTKRLQVFSGNIPAKFNTQ